ncbi:hypothetical protein EDD16DRAFT_251702 [Pisolithus croceorrhizus]|nr:hypothetical protein EDD16DRAFT_251702 [Pisolithus croceorrhizus]
MTAVAWGRLRRLSTAPVTGGVLASNVTSTKAVTLARLTSKAMPPVCQATGPFLTFDKLELGSSFVYREMLPLR